MNRIDADIGQFIAEFASQAVHFRIRMAKSFFHQAIDDGCKFIAGHHLVTLEQAIGISFEDTVASQFADVFVSPVVIRLHRGRAGSYGYGTPGGLPGRRIILHLAVHRMVSLPACFPVSYGVHAQGHGPSSGSDAQQPYGRPAFSRNLAGSAYSRAPEARFAGSWC